MALSPYFAAEAVSPAKPCNKVAENAETCSIYLVALTPAVWNALLALFITSCEASPIEFANNVLTPPTACSKLA